MRVLVVSRGAAFGEGVGGMERAVADQVSDFLKLGLQVRLVVHDSTALGNVPPGLTFSVVPWPAWSKGGGRPSYGLAYWAWCIRLREWLELNALPGEIILFHGASVGAISKSLADEHFVISNPHGMEEFKFSLLRWPTRVFIRALALRARFVSKIVSTDRSLTPIVQKNFKCASDQIVMIPNSVNIAYLDSCAGSVARDPEFFSIVSVGRLASNKGYDLLLEALISLEKNGMLPKSTRWTHFGKGGQRKKLMNRYAKSQRKFGFSIVENASDSRVQSALACSSLFVQPSRYEGSSLTTLEAMAQSCLIVATPVGGIPDKIRNLENGFLAESATVNAIARAIVLAIECDEHPIRSAARFHVLSEFSSQTTANAYLQLFKSHAASSPSESKSTS